MTMNSTGSLTSSTILGASSECLLKGGYKRTPAAQYTEHLPEYTRMFEDRYGIVAVVYYDTWTALRKEWREAQAHLVEVISAYVRANDVKAWEGYLVLITPSSVGVHDHAEADEIRHDTSRVRKILATGDEMTNLADLNAILAPLLPLDDVSISDAEEDSVLDLVSHLLVQRGLSQNAIETVITAFDEQQPLLEQLHRLGEDT